MWCFVSRHTFYRVKVSSVLKSEFYQFMKLQMKFSRQTLNLSLDMSITMHAASMCLLWTGCREYIWVLPHQWKCISTEENLVDHASKGLKRCRPLTGSLEISFYWERQINFSIKISPELSIGDPEVKAVWVLNTDSTYQLSLTDHLSDISSVNKRKKAEYVMLKILQSVTYKDEINTICIIRFWPFLENMACSRWEGGLATLHCHMSSEQHFHWICILFTKNSVVWPITCVFIESYFQTESSCGKKWSRI